MTKKKALITGIRGQDGAYLAQLLMDKGYEVFGADRRSGEFANWRLKELGIENKLKVHYMDLLELTNVIQVIQEVKPTEIYNLAAQSFVGVSFDQPVLTSEINALGTLRLLEAIRLCDRGIRVYQASTSEMFGKVQETPQRESTPFYPRSPYAVAKLFAHWAMINYREAYGIFASSGILFNHESPLRGSEFVTRKITQAAARIKEGLQETVRLGNLDSKRDWGHAREYVEAMWLMLQQEKPDDYVVATGKTYSVREFVILAMKEIDVDIVWQGSGVNEKGVDKKTGKVRVEIVPEFFRPTEVDCLIGDAAKAKNKLGWQPKVMLPELVKEMVEADLRAVRFEMKNKRA